jgi:hypothetical protein
MSIVNALVALILTLSPIPARAAQAWVLWVEAPVGSDEWSIAPIPEPRFTAKEDCEQRAERLNDSEREIAKMQRMNGDSRDLFSCLPDTVDPRPEGALR